MVGHGQWAGVYRARPVNSPSNVRCLRDQWLLQRKPAEDPRPWRCSPRGQVGRQVLAPHLIAIWIAAQTTAAVPGHAWLEGATLQAYRRANACSIRRPCSGSPANAEALGPSTVRAVLHGESNRATFCFHRRGMRRSWIRLRAASRRTVHDPRTIAAHLLSGPEHVIPLGDRTLQRHL